jgi:hypothetical protein
MAESSLIAVGRYFPSFIFSNGISRINPFSGLFSINPQYM